VKVDAVIPAYKPGHDLRELVEKLLDQTVRLGRIIIINTDREYFDEKEYLIAPAVEVVHITRHEFDHAGTRDMGLRMSDADYVLFMTMDAIPKDNYLVEKLLSGFRRADNIAVSYARQLPKKDCNRIEQITREFNYPAQSRVQTSDDIKELGIKAYFCSDVCAMYDTSIYRSLGGFKAPAIFNEDMVYAAGALDAGYAVSYCADALVYHSHNYSGRQQFHRNFDLGVSQAEHPEIFEGVPSEGEGIRLVKRSLGYLIRTGHFWLIPQLIWQSGMKYAGYFLGKRYRKLPRKVVLACTMSPYYWNRK